MASGVKVGPECKTAFDELHNKHQHSFLIFRISDDDSTIIVEKKGEKNAPYSEFLEVRFGAKLNKIEPFFPQNYIFHIFRR